MLDGAAALCIIVFDSQFTIDNQTGVQRQADGRIELVENTSEGRNAALLTYAVGLQVAFIQSETNIAIGPASA